MTIFCWDGKHLAVDKEEYKLGVRVQRTEKYESFSTNEYPNVAVVGAGQVAQVKRLVGYIIEFLTADDDEIKDTAKARFTNYEQTCEDYDIVILTTDFDGKRQLFSVGANLHLHPVTTPYAGGHGDTVLCALGAMHAGATAEEALKIASDLTLIAKITTSEDYNVI